MGNPFASPARGHSKGYSAVPPTPGSTVFLGTLHSPEKRLLARLGEEDASEDETMLMDAMGEDEGEQDASAEDKVIEATLLSPSKQASQEQQATQVHGKEPITDSMCSSTAFILEDLLESPANAKHTDETVVEQSTIPEHCPTSQMSPAAVPLSHQDLDSTAISLLQPLSPSPAPMTLDETRLQSREPDELGKQQMNEEPENLEKRTEEAANTERNEEEGTATAIPTFDATDATDGTMSGRQDSPFLGLEECVNAFPTFAEETILPMTTTVLPPVEDSMDVENCENSLFDMDVTAILHEEDANGSVEESARRDNVISPFSRPAQPQIADERQDEQTDMAEAAVNGADETSDLDAEAFCGEHEKDGEGRDSVEAQTLEQEREVLLVDSITSDIAASDRKEESVVVPQELQTYLEGSETPLGMPVTSLGTEVEAQIHAQDSEGAGEAAERDETAFEAETSLFTTEDDLPEDVPSPATPSKSNMFPAVVQRTPLVDLPASNGRRHSARIANTPPAQYPGSPTRSPVVDAQRSFAPKSTKRKLVSSSTGGASPAKRSRRSPMKGVADVSSAGSNVAMVEQAALEAAEPKKPVKPEETGEVADPPPVPETGTPPPKTRQSRRLAAVSGLPQPKTRSKIATWTPAKGGSSIPIPSTSSKMAPVKAEPSAYTGKKRARTYKEEDEDDDDPVVVVVSRKASPAKPARPVRAANAGRKKKQAAQAIAQTSSDSDAEMREEGDRTVVIATSSARASMAAVSRASSTIALPRSPLKGGRGEGNGRVAYDWQNQSARESVHVLRASEQDRHVRTKIFSASTSSSSSSSSRIASTLHPPTSPIKSLQGFNTPASPGLLNLSMAPEMLVLAKSGRQPSSERLDRQPSSESFNASTKAPYPEASTSALADVRQRPGSSQELGSDEQSTNWPSIEDTEVPTRPNIRQRSARPRSRSSRLAEAAQSTTSSSTCAPSQKTPAPSLSAAQLLKLTEKNRLRNAKVYNIHEVSTIYKDENRPPSPTSKIRKVGTPKKARDEQDSRAERRAMQEGLASHAEGTSEEMTAEDVAALQKPHFLAAGDEGLFRSPVKGSSMQAAEDRNLRRERRNVKWDRDLLKAQRSVLSSPSKVKAREAELLDARAKKIFRANTSRRLDTFGNVPECAESTSPIAPRTLVPISKVIYKDDV